VTVTVNEHIVSGLSGLASVAVQLTVVVPTENIEPLIGLHIILAPGQLSDAVAMYVTVAWHAPIAAGCVIGEGRLHVGACVSCTVTVNEHIVSGLSGLVSVAVQLTVVVPTENIEPLIGLHIMLAPGQLSEAVAMYVTVALH
jgi:hypothetical protein